VILEKGVPVMAAHKKHAQPQDVGLHAHAIAEAVRASWHSSYGSGRVEVPVSVVATLAAAPRTTPDGANVTNVMSMWTSDELASYTKCIWTGIIRQRPDLTQPLYPLIAWVFDDSGPEVWSHAHGVAQAALRAGQVDLTGSESRREVDLLGVVLTVLRPDSALKERGQFYTPACVAKLMACMTEAEEGGRVHDPTMGTGGLFRAVAERMRETDRDPATVRWVGCDIDELAVACATVNSMIWGLGHDILFYAGNALTEDGLTVALAQRDELRQIAADIRWFQRALSLLEAEPDP
jgi:hypothetical protein